MNPLIPHQTSDSSTDLRSSEETSLISSSKKNFFNGYHSIEAEAPQIHLNIGRVKEIKEWSQNEIDEIAKGLAEGLTTGEIILTRNPKSHYALSLSPKGFITATKQDKTIYNTIKSQLSHGIPRGHLFTRAARIAAQLRGNELRIIPRMRAFQAASEAASKILTATSEAQKLPNNYPPKEGNIFQLLGKNNAELTLVHSGTTEKFFMDRISPRNTIQEQTFPIVLIYGMHESRRQLFKDLVKTLNLTDEVGIFVMNQLNYCAGISPSSMQTEMNKTVFKIIKGDLTLNEEAIEELSERFPQGTPEEKKELLTQIALRWQNFLKEHSQTFDVSEKINSSNWLNFLFKNIQPQEQLYEKINSPKSNSEEQRQDLEKFLLPVKESILKFFIFAKDSPNEEVFQERLVKELGPLLQNKQQEPIPELSIYVQQFISHSVWRKTSKLGLSFAAQESIPIFFSWQIPGNKREHLAMEESLKAFPYKDSPPKFYRYYNSSSEQYSYKPITYSEFHQLARLLKKELTSSQKNLAPNFLLVQNIQKMVNSKKTTLRLGRHNFR